MEIDDTDYEVINTGAIDLDQLLPAAQERIEEKGMIDHKYRHKCRQLAKGDVTDNNYELKDDISCWKNRIYAPEGMRKPIFQSEHDSKVAGHFGRVRTLDLITRNLYCPNMESDVRKFCNECDNCQSIKCPRDSPHGLLHPLELACMAWTKISRECITDLPASEGATIILMVGDRFTKMAHFILIKMQDSPMVASAYLKKGFELSWVFGRCGFGSRQNLHMSIFHGYLYLLRH